VRKRTTGMLYAMKVINKGHIIDKDKIESTICERKILSMLNHPCIVSLHWAFTSVSYTLFA
jgi:serine/threonine protein kinase